MDYVSIRVSTLRGDQKINFNAYIKINDKMILYLKNGDSFEGTRLQRLKEKKLKKMFILTEDETQYRTYLQKNIEIAYDDKSGKDINTRAEIIQGQQQSNTEEVFENPENETNYYTAKDAAGKYVQFLLNNSEAAKSVMKIENADQNIAHHGVTVSTLAVSLANKLGFTDPKQTQLLALGALLHDFGHYESSVSPAKHLKDMTPQELEIYRNHCEVGARKVHDKKHFDQNVINIIMQHEECVDGSGYPRKLNESKTDPLAVIVSSANALDRLITFEGVAKQEAAKKLMIEHVGKHPLNHIKLLSEIMKNLV